MTRRCCCGCGSFWDPFERPDNTYLGDAWEERVALSYPADGDVEIYGQCMRFRGDVPQGHATVKPSASLAMGPGQEIYVVVRDVRAGLSPVILFNYLDWNRHHRLVYEFGTPGSVTMKLQRVFYNPLTPTLLRAETFTYTYSEVELVGGFIGNYGFWGYRPGGGDPMWVCLDWIYETGTRFGLTATGSTYPCDYDSILYQEAWYPSRPNCPAFGCHCTRTPTEKICGPMDLTGTFVPVSGCDNLLGKTFEIKTGGDPLAPPLTAHTFRTTTCEISPGYGFEVHGSLACPSGDLYTARLLSNLIGDNQVRPQSTCSPLLMVFGPYYTYGPQPNQGHCWDGVGQPCTSSTGAFYIHVTG